jgi:hypothetical protein
MLHARGHPVRPTGDGQGDSLCEDERGGIFRLRNIEIASTLITTDSET